MKLTILQNKLLESLTTVGRIISPKAQLPILQNLLIEAKENMLFIIGTNTETSIVSKNNARVNKEGGVCIPAKIFIEFITSLPEGNVELETKEGELIVVSNGYEAKIPTVPKEEFPPLPEIKNKKAIEISKTDFLKALDAVLFSAATDEGRPILTGVKIKRSGEETIFVATDGYRLSLKRIEDAFKEVIDITIPAKALNEVVRVGDGNKEETKIKLVKIDDSQLGFFIGETEIYTRVLDGEYPNFEKILPKKTGTRVEVEKDQFLQAIKSAAIFARDNANIIRFSISSTGVVISANTPQVGQNKISLEAVVEGEGGDIAFNSRFVVDFLSHASEEKIQFEMTGSLNPGVFKSIKEDGFIHIIMPVRINS